MAATQAEIHSTSGRLLPRKPTVPAATLLAPAFLPPPLNAGSVGAISSVTPSNEATSPATSLTVNWVQDNPDAATNAAYQLWRYPTGATDSSGRTDVCSTVVSISQAKMDDVTEAGGTLTLAGVSLCDRSGDTTLGKGR